MHQKTSRFHALGMHRLLYGFAQPFSNRLFRFLLRLFAVLLRGASHRPRLVKHAASQSEKPPSQACCLATLLCTGTPLRVASTLIFWPFFGASPRCAQVYNSCTALHRPGPPGFLVLHSIFCSGHSQSWPRQGAYCFPRLGLPSRPLNPNLPVRCHQRLCRLRRCQQDSCAA